MHHLDASPASSALRERFAIALRQLGHTLVGRELGDATLENAAKTLEGLLPDLTANPTRSRPPESWANESAAAFDDGAEMTSHADRPFSGPASPLGTGLRVHRFGDGVEAHVTFQAAHEGPPGRVHGGVLAGLFDDVFGFLMMLSKTRAFTGELTVRYEAGVPLYEPIVVRCSFDRREGRKLFLLAELLHRERRLVTAKSTFIAMDTLLPA